MGLFLALSGIGGSSADEVKRCMQSMAVETGRTFEPAGTDVDELDIMVISEAAGGRVSVLYPSGLMEWDEVSQELSKRLGKPVFSFHIHDGDFWMYRLFANGEEVDCFNPVPEYWGEVNEQERARWSGNALRVAEHWPKVEKEDVRNYLIHWELADLAGAGGKAYPDDEYRIGSDWQLCDFMRRLGLVYPIDEKGARRGEKFVFGSSDSRQVGDAGVGDKARKPWWKFW